VDQPSNNTERIGNAVAGGGRDGGSRMAAIAQNGGSMYSPTRAHIDRTLLLLVVDYNL